MKDSRFHAGFHSGFYVGFYDEFHVGFYDGFHAGFNPGFHTGFYAEFHSGFHAIGKERDRRSTGQFTEQTTVRIEKGNEREEVDMRATKEES